MAAESALLAQLLGMGFEIDQIEACQLALASSNTPLTLQAATDWLLRQGTSQQDGTVPAATASHQAPPERPATLRDINRPTSSGSTLISPGAPLRSRYDLGEEHRRGKERFMAKERDEAVKSARRMRMAEAQAKAQIKQQIAEDRKRRSERSTNPVPPSPSAVADPPKQLPATTSSSSKTASCRVQVRLPNGKVLRNSFSADALLGDVSKFVLSETPSLHSVQLVQPFPHREFSEEESHCTLQSLGLCPSASLVVSKQQQQPPGTTATPPHSKPMELMDTSEPVGVVTPPQLVGVVTPPLPVGMVVPPQPVGMVVPPQPVGMVVPPQPVRVVNPPQPLLPGPVQDNDDQEEEEDEDEEDMDQDVAAGRPLQPLPHFPRNNPFHPGRQGLFVAGGGGFEGAGHRLGGNEHPMRFGDAQEVSRHVSDSARVAAQRRAEAITVAPISSRATATLSPARLEVCCLRELTKWSSVHRLPSCSSLSPRAAQLLLTALADAKQLHPKTLTAFLKCPLQSMILDSYSLTTNHLLDMVKCFPTLQHLSLASCGLITDRGVTQLLPHLPQLTHLSLNGCHQLSDKVFHEFRNTASQQLKVVKLSQLKLTDHGVRLLLRRPLTALVELDLSSTLVTADALNLLSHGTPNLQSLSIESTKISDVYPLLRLPHLHTLNLARCPVESKLQLLSDLQALTSLSLAGISVGAEELTGLSGLQLKSLVLPDRNMFLDQHLEVVAGLPLTSLNLAGYCNITDYGIANLHRMTRIVDLDLSRTKLTDEGMPHLQHLVQLTRLSLDSTFITDEGLMFIAGLENLEDLSVSDIHVSSKFILNGALTLLRKLHKLNLVRTAIDDEGLLHIALPSLLMLNIDWTCASEVVTLETLRQAGCRCLETLRNRNIEQPLPSWMRQEQ